MSFESESFGAPFARAEDVGLQEYGYGNFALSIDGIITFVAQRGEYVYLVPRIDTPIDARKEIS